MRRKEEWSRWLGAVICSHPIPSRSLFHNHMSILLLPFDLCAGQYV
jgi:hypothetical protein